MSLRSIGFPGLPLSGLSRRTILLALAASIAGAVAAGGTSGPSPSVAFSGPVDPGGGVPPDVQGAAGPDHLLAMLNTTFVAQRKSDGAVVRTWSPAEFWSPVSGGDRLFDPRVLWDSGAERWVAVIATEGVAAAPAILLAVSETSDPTAGWTFRKLPVGGQAYAEFPLLGSNARWIVVTSNLVSGTTGYLAGTAIWAIDKAALLAGSPGATRFTLDSPGSPIAPAVTFDPDAPDELLLQQADGNDIGHGRIRLFRISDAGAGPALAAPVLLSVGETWGDLPSPLESLPQADTTRHIVSDQDEFSSVCVRHGKIWAVQTATLPASAGTPAHTVVQWWRIGEDGKVEGFGRIGDPAGKTWLGFP
ncbi:MAG TPA: hypothetical protein VFL12_01690, partial [Thermoanaerobaculia bacterium]|nr:hypothetical protein [Thermoanaerobaculia bacterium]